MSEEENVIESEVTVDTQGEAEATPEEAPKTLLESLEDAYNGQPDEEVEQEPGESEETEEESEEGEEEKDTASGGDEPTEVDLDIEIPDEFSPDEKQAYKRFAAIDLDAAKVALGRYDNIRRGFQEATRAYSPIKEILEPIRGDLAVRGISTAQYVSNLVEIDRLYSQSPERAIKLLAEKAGVDPTSFSGELYEGQYDGDTDPQAMRKIQELEKKLESFEQSQHQQTEAQRRDALIRQANEFESAKDVNGDLKHPFVDDVADHMAKLMGADKSMTLEQAYDMAVWSNPKTREKLMAQSSGKQDAPRESIESKKRASKSVSSSKTKPKVKSEAKSMGDELRNVWNDLASASA